MSDLTQEEAEAMVEDFYTNAEELEAEENSRIDALQDYIAEEEAEIKALAMQRLEYEQLARDLEEEFDIE